MNTRALGRILVVEDDRSLALAWRVGLRRVGYEATVVEDGNDLPHLLEQWHPDLALLDVSLPVGPDGFELAYTVRSLLDIPVLFVTAADSLADRLAGFDAGADDYLVKPFALAELVARVRAVLRRTGRLSSPVVEIRDFVLNENDQTVMRSGRRIPLTPTEFDLFMVLVRNAGQVMSKAQLLSSVWGFDEYDPNLVEVHVSALRRKIDRPGSTLIRTERGRGYVVTA
ncbi:MAG TPA: response regulator transcription factor [Acidimicrobiales bacterium]|nr:response regulator transcription factor [Acidimicrobiales bacterium]